jgi:hypothetical protein
MMEVVEEEGVVLGEVWGGGRERAACVDEGVDFFFLKAGWVNQQKC